MYWHAEKINGDIIVLTEEEALTHFESNNVSNRMKLRFIGTSTGNHQQEARKKIQAIIVEHRPDDYGRMKPEDRNWADSEIRAEHIDEIRLIIKEAGKLELEEAKKVGVKQPDKMLRIKTPGGDRAKILGSGNISGMMN